MAQFTRRDFLRTGVAASVLSTTGGLALAKRAKRSATDWVILGKSKVKVTRLAFGTGTMGGRLQRELGQDEFTRLVRYAYDRGIRFFETAESYHGMPEMLAIALKGLPRDSYRLMTKYSTPAAGDPALSLFGFVTVTTGAASILQANNRLIAFTMKFADASCASQCGFGTCGLPQSRRGRSPRGR